MPWESCIVRVQVYTPKRQKYLFRPEQTFEFVSRVDEAHLLPIAIDVFGSVPFPVKTEYVPQRKNTKSTATVVARRLHFESYYSFILTDFFEGLHYGHYPRLCEVCKRYFLMTSAHRQRYCNRLLPYEHKGKQLTCRKYATSIKTASEILQAGLRNTQFIDYFYKHTDEDGEKSREKVAYDNTFEPDKLYFKLDQANKVMSAFETLNYRQAIDKMRKEIKDI